MSILTATILAISLFSAFLGGVTGVLLKPSMKDAESAAERVLILGITLVFTTCILGSSLGLHILIAALL